MSEWYRSLKIQAFVGIRRSDLDAALPASVLKQYSQVLDDHTESEPLTVQLRDLNYTKDTTPLILALETVQIQIDASLNEIPRATCVMACGRDGTLLANGESDLDASSIVHLLEKYLNGFVPTRIYANVTVTAAAGPPLGGPGDILPDTGEWLLLFDGISLGPTRRGTPESYSFVLHLTHVLSQLTYSSTLSSIISSGTEMPFAFNQAVFTPNSSANSGIGFATTAGSVALTLAGGFGLYTDFWGFNIPAIKPSVNSLGQKIKGSPQSGGLKTFLTNLASQDAFNWLTFNQTGAKFCAPRPTKNDGALDALSRMEPYTITSVNPALDYGVLRTALDTIRKARTAAGSIAAITRSDLITAIGSARYNELGYRYSMPIAFYLNQAALGAFSQSTGFANDIVQAAFHDLAPSSFWELLSSKFSGRYQIAISPNSAGALVIPFQPLMDKYWQTIYASEIFSWDDDVRNPVPVRGVIMTSPRRSDAGTWGSGNQASSFQGAFAAATGDAAYDSCQPGVFIYRSMPPWLATAFRNGSVFAPASILGPRAAAAVPWSTAPAAIAQLSSLVSATPAAAGLSAAAAFAAIGMDPGAPLAPSQTTRSTGYLMAKALYQQVRTQPRNVYLTGRFRTDIAPGSLLRLELPGDRYVRASLDGGLDAYMFGTVLRVTIFIDSEGTKASTSFQLGFTRTEGETDPGDPLYSNTHPFWQTITLGSPFCDSVAMRTLLGNNSDINYRGPGIVGAF